MSFGTNTPYRYGLYGLGLWSNRPIILLPAQPAAPSDLVVNWTTNKSESPDARVPWERVLTEEMNQKRGIALWRGNTGEGIFTKLRFETPKGHFDFILDPSRQKLWIIYSETDAQADLDSYFVGPVLGCVLRLRGTLCLHASVVKIDDRAVALVGGKKVGKSTSAAGLAQLGALVMSDDMAVLMSRANHFLVHPGYPQIRLWPKSLEAIYPDTELLPRVYTHREKCYLPLGAGGGNRVAFWSEPLPLANVYLLQEDARALAEPYIEDMTPQEKLMSLVANTFGGYVVSENLRRQEFTTLAQLSRSVPVRRSVFAHDLSMLPAQSRTILADVRGQHHLRPAAARPDLV